MVVDEFMQRARQAFALGWSSTGGPLTTRVRAGMVAAVDLACTRHLQPGVLETTLHLGKLEGTWARVYQRREQLYTDHTALITTAWRDLAATSSLDIAGSVAGFRRECGLASETTSDDEAADRRERAAALALLLLALLVRDRSQQRYKALISAVSEAIRAGEAEGVAGAVAIGAQQLGYPAVDFDQVYATAYAEAGTPADRDARAAAAAAVIADIVRGSATDVGALWARMVGEGGDYGDMVGATSDLLGGDDQRAVSVPVDLAMGAAFTRSGLAVFRDGGATTVDFLTAGDGRVCPFCLAAEAAGPYPLASAPAPPLHPFCRCTLSTTSLTGLVLAHYLGGTS